MPPDIKIEEIRVISEGGPGMPEEDKVISMQAKEKQSKRKVEEKLMKRLKTKCGVVQERRSWGMAKAMTKCEAWNAIVKHKGLIETYQMPPQLSTTE